MKLAIILDPLESIKIYKDSTYAMMREAQSRGHAIWACESADLHWRGGAPTLAADAAALPPEGVLRAAWGGPAPLVPTFASSGLIRAPPQLPAPTR